MLELRILFDVIVKKSINPIVILGGKRGSLARGYTHLNSVFLTHGLIDRLIRNTYGVL